MYLLELCLFVGICLEEAKLKAEERGQKRGYKREDHNVLENDEKNDKRAVKTRFPSMRSDLHRGYSHNDRQKAVVVKGEERQHRGAIAFPPAGPKIRYK